MEITARSSRNAWATAESSVTPTWEFSLESEMWTKTISELSAGSTGPIPRSRNRANCASNATSNSTWRCSVSSVEIELTANRIAAPPSSRCRILEFGRPRARRSSSSVEVVSTVRLTLTVGTGLANVSLFLSDHHNGLIYAVRSKAPIPSGCPSRASA
jgi:hypothetical protein